MKQQQFQKTVFAFYRKLKRTLPWRQTRDPYKILISEMMLQQTQVSRVLDKYSAFIKKFPSVHHLEKALFKDVLSVWHGLGYNRRAKYLHQAAKEIVEKYNGIFPKTIEELTALPGIGTSTAGAVLAFSTNKPVVFIETNIRSVFIHHFFADKKDVADRDLLPLIEKTLDKKNPRDWYYALMDYGVHLKKLHKNPSRKSTHYLVQSKFEGSNRQLRGQILKFLLKGASTQKQLRSSIKAAPVKVQRVLKDLEKEGFIKKQKGAFTINS